MVFSVWPADGARLEILRSHTCEPAVQQRWGHSAPRSRPCSLRPGPRWQAVHALTQDMHRGRVQRLQRLGFEPAVAHELSSLHTRNFM